MRVCCRKQINLNHRIWLALLLAAPFAAPASAQSVAPGEGPAHAQIRKATRVETEVVTITSYGAVPSEIKRKRGKFFLVLNSTGIGGPPPLVISSPTMPAAKVSTVVQGLSSVLLNKFKKAAVACDLPEGELHIKSQSTGKTLLKITIQ